MNRTTTIVFAVILGIVIWTGTDFFLRKNALNTLLGEFKKSSSQIATLIDGATEKKGELQVHFQSYSEEAAKSLKNKILKTKDRENILYSWDVVFEKMRDHLKKQSNSIGKFFLITTKNYEKDNTFKDNLFGVLGLASQTDKLKGFDKIAEKNLPGVPLIDIKTKNGRMNFDYLQRVNRDMEKYNLRFNQEKEIFEYLVNFVLSTEKVCTLLTESAKEGEKPANPYFIEKFNDTCLDKYKEIYEWIP